MFELFEPLNLKPLPYAAFSFFLNGGAGENFKMFRDRFLGTYHKKAPDIPGQNKMKGSNLQETFTASPTAHRLLSLTIRA